MKNCVIGILAHVDAGKTTLSEAMLYRGGVLRRVGRVDRGDAFLDTDAIERERGITVFSKMASLPLGDMDLTLLDTPGHADFAAECERALSVVDACILVLSATDPIRAHTRVLWRLLEQKKIPTVLFVNKMDLCTEGRRCELLAGLRAAFAPECVDFTLRDRARFLEEVSGASETLMARYFDGEDITDEQIKGEIAARAIFPVYFGSALRCDGVDALLEGLARFLPTPSYGETLGLKVYKIARDPAGARLSYLKVTGGTLRAKDTVRLRRESGEFVEEKVESIRLYSGEKYKNVAEAMAGGLYAVLGLHSSYAGQGIGAQYRERESVFEPILTYRLELPEGVNPYDAYQRIMPLGEEDPTLHLFYDEQTKEIRLSLMGEIQLEILSRVLRERFGLAVTFGEGDIVYKETVAACVRGAGHFEPLRHYAEVHLEISPLPAGSGVVCESDCSTDVLAQSWQRLILTHLGQKVHRGVLTGSPLTDVRIVVKGGRAHQKHTEGGDFRRATYRAVRQGLMKAESVLLEPYFDFLVELPEGQLGRAMTDLSALGARLESPEILDGRVSLRGRAPYVRIRHYARELRAYTKGEGQINLTMAGYFPAHNAEEVIAAREYDPMLDEWNTPNSVFCKNGSGYVVPWDEADALMHAPPEAAYRDDGVPVRAIRQTRTSYADAREEDRALQAIFEQTYGKIKKRTVKERVEYTAPKEERQRAQKPKPKGDTYVLVDGYNIIFAWDELRRLGERSLVDGRDALVRIMANYAGYRRCKVIVVFDAYLVRGGEGSVERMGDLSVVYTKERQTADAYIERTSRELAREHFVRVATSDGAQQMIILGNGAFRISAKEFYDEVCATDAEIQNFL